MQNTSKWQYSGDKNMLDYGGKNFRHIGARKFQFVELINMEEACGRDNEGQPKYNVSLRMVDLSAISEKNLDSALSSCGPDQDREGMADIVMAESCDSYGCHAPLDSWSGNNARKLLREAYRRAGELLDQSTLAEQLQKPVNKIGSTAAEFMAGDIFSGIQRGCESGNVDSRIMAKMYGIPQAAIDDARPADFLPYVFGYMAGRDGGAKETDPDTSPEYFRGYDRGQAVKAGTCPAPSWITQQPVAA